MTAAIIERVHALRVWDSRGRPTIEVAIATRSGTSGRAIAPAGASTGSGEAVDLRDGGAASMSPAPSPASTARSPARCVASTPPTSR